MVLLYVYLVYRFSRTTCAQMFVVYLLLFLLLILGINAVQGVGCVQVDASEASPWVVELLVPFVCLVGVNVYVIG